MPRRQIAVLAVAAATLTSTNAGAVLPADPPRNAAGPAVAHAGIETLLAQLPLPEGGTVATPCSVEMSVANLPADGLSCATSSEDAPPAAPGARMEQRDLVRTARWGAKVAPMNSGRLARVHGFGDVAVHGPDGEVVWARSGDSLHDDWNLPRWIVPFVLIGVSPLDPWAVASERPFAVGDLTGDGLDDLVVAHYLMILQPDRTTTHDGAMVTVLDGATGEARWMRPFPGYVTQMLIHDRTLVVGNETGNRRGGSGKVGENGTTSALRAFDFEVAGSELVGTETWTYDTGAQWARLLTLEPTRAGAFAFGWTAKAVGAAGTPGTLVHARVSDGSVLWSRDTSGYPRRIRYDAARDRIVLHDQADPGVGTRNVRSYWISGYDATSGLIAARVHRMGALLISFEIGDARGSNAAEWVVGDLEQLRDPATAALPNTYPTARVSLIDGDNPTTHWTYRVEMPSEFVEGRGGGLASWPIPYSVLVTGAGASRRVLVGVQHLEGDDSVLALDGASGGVLWERFGSVTNPAFGLLPVTVGGEQSALAVSRNQVLRAVRASDGATVLDVPLLGDLTAALAFDVDGDGNKDILTGGESGAVFALDSDELSDAPTILWRTTVGSAIRRIELVDLDGYGGDELVVAATDAIAALDPATGSLLWRREMPALTWTFVVAELDGDIGDDLVVPTQSLLALRGVSGKTLWEYVAAEDLDARQAWGHPTVTPEGQVVAPGLISFPDPLAPRHHQLLVGLDSATGTELWSAPHIEPRTVVGLWEASALAGRTADGEGSLVAVLRYSNLAQIMVDLVDARTGERVAGHGPADGAVHMGMRSDEHGLNEFNWVTVWHLDEPVEVDFNETGPSTDVEWARLADGSEVFLRAFHRVWSYAGDMHTGAHGVENPPFADEYDHLFAGGLSAADLDGDGDDEVLAHTFDWRGFAAVVGQAGTSVVQADLLVHGLAVLDLVAE